MSHLLHPAQNLALNSPESQLNVDFTTGLLQTFLLSFI